MKKKSSVLVCPKCNTIDVRMESQNPIHAIGVPQLYVCNNCHYSAYTFPTMTEDAFKKFAKSNKVKGNVKVRKEDKQLIDTSYGKFQVRVWWRLAGPVMLVVGLLVFPFSMLGGLSAVIAGLVMTYLAYRKL